MIRRCRGLRLLQVEVENTPPDGARLSVRGTAHPTGCRVKQEQLHAISIFIPKLRIRSTKMCPVFRTWEVQFNGVKSNYTTIHIYMPDIKLIHFVGVPYTLPPTAEVTSFAFRILIPCPCPLYHHVSSLGKTA